MRVPGTKIYRAFEELDKFTDEQCQRFLTAALRPWWRRAARWAACGALAVVLFSVLVVGWAVIAFSGNWRMGQDGWVTLIGTAVICAVPAFAAALLRDWFLRRRMSYVINNRSSCNGCGYKLLGLPVPESNVVVCPECGQPSEVDMAMGELAITADGARTFTPVVRVGAEGFWKRSWTVWLMRWTKRGAIAAAVLVVLATCGVVWHLAAVDRQAKRAEGMIASVDDWKRHIKGLQPAGVKPENTNGWDLFQDYSTEFGMICRETMIANKEAIQRYETASSFPIGDIHFPYLGVSGPERASSDDAIVNAEREYEIHNMLAKDAVQRMRASGLLKKLDDMVSVRRYEPQPLAGQDRLRYGSGDYRAFYRLMLMQKGRISLAVMSGDGSEAVNAFAGAMALTRLATRSQNELDLIRARNTEPVLVVTILPLLPKATSEQLRSLAEILERAVPLPPLVEDFEAIRIGRCDDVCRVFVEQSSVRWGIASTTSMQRQRMTPSSWWNALPLGSLDSNLAEVENWMSTAKQLAVTRAIDRPSPAEVGFESPKHYLTAELGIPQGAVAMQSRCDMAMMAFDGLVTQVAIERYERARGEYPERLKQLLPEYLKALPPDAWSYGPLVYRRLDTADAQGRRYLLYSVGPDQIDGGGIGVEASEMTERAYSTSGVGLQGDIGFGQKGRAGVEAAEK